MSTRLLHQARHARHALASGETLRVLAAADAAGQAVGRALLDARRDAAADADRRWLDSIERHRATLDASREPLTSDGALTVGLANRQASTKPPFGRLLFRLVRELRPEVCLELGTSLGMSSSYQAAALLLNGSGHLTTIERNPARAEVARRSFAELGVQDHVSVRTGDFRHVLDGVLGELGAIGFAYIDGHHDGAATLAYHDAISARLVAPYLLVFDDIRWSSGMRDAWNRIAGDPRSRLAVDVHQVGIVLRGEGEPLGRRLFLL